MTEREHDSEESISPHAEPDFDHYSNHPDGAREVGDGATCVICGLPFPCPDRPDVARP